MLTHDWLLRITLLHSDGKQSRLSPSCQRSSRQHSPHCPSSQAALSIPRERPPRPGAGKHVECRRSSDGTPRNPCQLFEPRDSNSCAFPKPEPFRNEPLQRQTLRHCPLSESLCERTLGAPDRTATTKPSTTRRFKLLLADSTSRFESQARKSLAEGSDEQYDPRLDDNEAYNAAVQAPAECSHAEFPDIINPVRAITDDPDRVAELKGKKGKGKAVEKKTAATTKKSKPQPEPKQEDDEMYEERFLMQAELDNLEEKLDDRMFDKPLQPPAWPTAITSGVRKRWPISSEAAGAAGLLQSFQGCHVVNLKIIQHDEATNINASRRSSVSSTSTATTSTTSDSITPSPPGCAPGAEVPEKTHRCIYKLQGIKLDRILYTAISANTLIAICPDYIEQIKTRKYGNSTAVKRLRVMFKQTIAQVSKSAPAGLETTRPCNIHQDSGLLGVVAVSGHTNKTTSLLQRLPAPRNDWPRESLQRATNRRSTNGSI